MRKILFFLCVIAITAQAQKFEGVISVRQSGNKFVANLATGRSVQVPNPHLYRRILKSPGDFVYVSYDGDSIKVETFALRSNVSYKVVAVDSVGYDEKNDLAEVYFSDKTTYRSPNSEWLKVKKGRHVAMCDVDGETKIFRRLPHTVGEDVAETNLVPIAAPAPTTEAPAATVSAPVATAEAQAASTPLAKHRFVKR